MFVKENETRYFISFSLQTGKRGHTSAYENCITLRRNCVPHKQAKKSEGEMTRGRKKRVKSKRKETIYRDEIFANVYCFRPYKWTIVSYFSRDFSHVHARPIIIQTDFQRCTKRYPCYKDELPVGIFYPYRSFISLQLCFISGTSIFDGIMRGTGFRPMSSLYRWLSDRSRSSFDVLTYLIKMKNHEKNSLLIFLELAVISKMLTVYNNWFE